MTEDVCTYKILVRGYVDAGDINLTSPLYLDVDQTGGNETLLSVSTDQAGLVGLIRHLHGLGLVLLSVSSSLATDLPL